MWRWWKWKRKGQNRGPNPCPGSPATRADAQGFIWLKVLISRAQTKSWPRASVPSPRTTARSPSILHVAVSWPSPGTCERLTVDFKDGQTGLWPGKASSGGLIVVLVAILLPPTSFVASQCFCETKKPAETSTKKNAGKGGWIPWARIAWKEPKVEKEV